LRRDLQKASDFLYRDRFRQVPGAARRNELDGRIDRDALLASEETIETAQGNDHSCDRCRGVGPRRRGSSGAQALEVSSDITGGGSQGLNVVVRAVAAPGFQIASVGRNGVCGQAPLRTEVGEELFDL
jgi:hypothetical protein